MCFSFLQILYNIHTPFFLAVDTFDHEYQIHNNQIEWFNIVWIDWQICLVVAHTVFVLAGFFLVDFEWILLFCGRNGTKTFAQFLVPKHTVAWVTAPFVIYSTKQHASDSLFAHGTIKSTNRTALFNLVPVECC